MDSNNNNNDISTCVKRSLYQPFTPQHQYAYSPTVLYTPSKVLKGQFVQQTRASLAGDHFLYTCGLNV